MKRIWILKGIVLGIVLSGCIPAKHNPYPIAQHPETQYQLKMQAATQWQALANHQASKIAGAMPSGFKFYISASNSPSTFEIAYNRMLKAALIEKGFTITNVSDYAEGVVLSSAQIIQHKDRDSLKSSIGLASGASVGYLIAKNLTHSDHVTAAVIALAAASDYLQWDNPNAPTPDTEILMNTEVVVGNEIAFTNTAVYYLNPGDIGLYKKAKSTKALQVVDQ